MRHAVILLLLASTACAPVPSASANPKFEAHWQDGRAELDGYRLTISRYGESREGEAVMIFVTEPFSLSKRVKLDDPAAAAGDAVEVLKLNLVRDFQTGIYDYNTMVSVFSRSEDMSPLKISMSSAEWCGHVYEELIVQDDMIDRRGMSYFEGETANDSLERLDGVLEDNLYILLRGLRGAYLKPGERKSTAFLPSPFVARLTHESVKWTRAEVERHAKSERITVPAGTFEAIAYDVRMPVREGRFHIEAAWPHRILRWEWKPRGAAAGTASFPGGAESGELTGTTRLPYWKLHGNGDERHRADLGLAPR